MGFWNLKSWAVFQFQISPCFFHESAQPTFHPVNDIRWIQGNAWQLVILRFLTQVKKFLLPQLNCKCTKPLMRLDLYGSHPTSHPLLLTPKLTTSSWMLFSHSCTACSSCLLSVCSSAHLWQPLSPPLCLFHSTIYFLSMTLASYFVARVNY